MTSESDAVKEFTAEIDGAWSQFVVESGERLEMEPGAEKDVKALWCAGYATGRKRGMVDEIMVDERLVESEKQKDAALDQVAYLLRSIAFSNLQAMMAEKITL